MESQFEFGKDTRALELETLARRKTLTRRLISMGAVLLVAVLVFAFRNDLKLTGGGGNGKDKSLVAGTESKKQDGKTNAVSITRKWGLPAQLLEISGLSWMDANRVACVQDEEGIIFIYNIKDEKIEKQISFGGPGDYEGLALTGETAWVIRSDGRLFEVNMNGSEKSAAKEYATPLTAAHNTEGLGYDAKNNRLLIAIKENDPDMAGRKGIYSFDLATRKMAASPVFSIDLSHELIANTGSSSKKKQKEGGGFMPSAIAVHPVSGDIYITEGRNPRLMIMDAAGTIKKVYGLEKSEFNQPEGITFSSAGTMYISNEGSKKPGNILEVTLK